MSIKRAGQFIEFLVAGEGGGTRSLARVNAVQLVSETDCVGDEVLLTVANRTFRIGATLDQIRDILVEQSGTARARTSPPDRGPVQRGNTSSRL